MKGAEEMSDAHVLLLGDLWRRFDDAALELFLKHSREDSGATPIEPVRDVVCALMTVAASFARAFGCPAKMFVALAEQVYSDERIAVDGGSSAVARQLMRIGRGEWN
ncbi:MAG: hypothetical protein IPM35_16605 [Myxococcales bacterium]|nr:hypothetical protein [Myxococcales bacterium]